MHWRAVLAGVAWGVSYLACCYLLAPLEHVGVLAVPLVLGAGPLAGAAAGVLARGGPAKSARHGLLAGAVAGLAFGALLWHVLSVSRFQTLTPFGDGGAFFALKLLFVHGAGDLPLLRQSPGRMAGLFALLGVATVTALGGYAGHAAERREAAGLLEWQ